MVTSTAILYLKKNCCMQHCLSYHVLHVPWEICTNFQSSEEDLSNPEDNVSERVSLYRWDNLYFDKVCAPESYEQLESYEQSESYV